VRNELFAKYSSWAEQFGSFGGRVWLNCAHQGPIPHVAVDAARATIEQKQSPHLIPDEAFWEVPLRLKEKIGSLINAPDNEIILGNSTSYGLNLLVQGLPWKIGDEVLVVHGDFPATVVTWLPLQKLGVKVRFLTPKDAVPTVAELERAITPSTRLFCCSWVFSFFGHAIDLDAIGEACRAHNILFVLNGSQAIGTRSIDIMSSHVDAIVSCGFKWLCGPYATGFCWMRPEVLDSLTFEPAYWLAQVSESELGDEGSYRLRQSRDASTYDVFGTANFLNFVPLTASIKLLLDAGIDVIAKHNDDLVARFLSGLDTKRFELVSPAAKSERSTLVTITPHDRSSTASVHRALSENGVDVALRGDKIRFSPHLYNTDADIDKALGVLAHV
jgi:cysteine desulfurase / selenocysteine lyase